MNWGPWTPMRTSAALFALPLGMALGQQKSFGAVVYGFVMLTTFATHRPRQAWTRGFREDVDLVAVLLWYLYNTLLTIDTLKKGTLQPGWLALALCGAVGSVVLDRLRCRQVYRCPKRDLLHMSMHLSGALGTSCLLLANNG